jgi:hypothetical protein
MRSRVGEVGGGGLMRFIAGYADLYDEYAGFCSALKQMKDRRPAVNVNDALGVGNRVSQVSVLQQDIAVRERHR